MSCMFLFASLNLISSDKGQCRIRFVKLRGPRIRGRPNLRHPLCFCTRDLERASRVKRAALPLSVRTSAPCNLCISCWPAAREGRDYTQKKVNRLLNQYLLPSPARRDSLDFLLWGISCAENERRKEKERRGERHVNEPCVTSSSGGEGALFIDLSHTHIIKRNFSIGL